MMVTVVVPEVCWVPEEDICPQALGFLDGEHNRTECSMHFNTKGLEKCIDVCVCLCVCMYVLLL